MQPDNFTVPEFAAWARIGRTKIYELIRAGELPVVRLGGKNLIRRVDGEKLLDRYASKSGETAAAVGGDEPT